VPDTQKHLSKSIVSDGTAIDKAQKPNRKQWILDMKLFFAFIVVFATKISL
jgi:hypothetical protein